MTYEQAGFIVGFLMVATVAIGILAVSFVPIGIAICDHLKRIADALGKKEK